MLWKKESPQPGALYTDIFTPSTEQCDSNLNSFLQTIVQTPHPQKSNAIALQKRNEGNVKFRAGAWLKAIDLYNDSLRFAVPGSEHISLAYANRASCFLKLKMYDECLADIELAKKADYPEYLRPKLDQRKENCLKEMQEEPQNREELRIEPNELCPYLTNKAKIQRNGVNGGYSVVAEEDIDVGELVVIDYPYQIFVWRRLETYCNICSKAYGNLVPCKECASAMFCPECQGHFLHDHECGLNFCDESDFNSGTMGSVRSILLVLKMFSSADELMVFVEKMLKKPNELPESLLDDRSKYQAYFNSPWHSTTMPFLQMKLQIYSTYKTLLRIPHVNEMFNTTKHRRFLMHLIGHHKTLPELSAGRRAGGNGPLSRLGTSVHVSPVMQNYFKHSCDPNVLDYTNGGKTVLHSIKPIKKGAELFITCGEREIKGMRSTKERKKFLLDQFKINCECSRCLGEQASPAQRQQLASDPAYQYIESNMNIVILPMVFNGEKAKHVMDTCATLLRQYGQISWCEELYTLLQAFHRIYRIQLTAGGRGLSHPLPHAVLWNCMND